MRLFVHSFEGHRSACLAALSLMFASTVMPAETTISVANEIPGTVTIDHESDGMWLVRQQKLPEQGPVGTRPPDYAQAPTWVRIENDGEARTVSLAVQWIDTGYMALRKAGYLKRDGVWTVVSGEVSTDRTTYRLEVPKGTSWFGPVPWYGNEDATKWMDRIAAAHLSVRVRALGKTKEGREVRCLTIGDERRPNVLVVGREHGGESASSFAVEAVVEHLLSPEFPREMREAFCFHIIPLANPDGVANGTKFPQLGPVERSDLHYAGLSATDPTCVVMREETQRLRPVCYLNYHSYLFSSPQIIFYNKDHGMKMLDHLIGSETGSGIDWHVKRLSPGGDSLLYHCHRAFGSVVALFEMPWAGRKVETIRAQGVATFRAAMETVMAQNDASKRP